MLRVYEPDQLMAVIDAVAAFPFMGDYGKRFTDPAPGRTRRDSVELIFRDEKHVEDLLALGAANELTMTDGSYLDRLVAEVDDLRGLLKTAMTRW